MTPTAIDKIIFSFLNKEIDVLLCTTIIETGIDIANANTLIVEYADTLGLSQLYQLRGRVGRSEQIAYAYLTYARDRALTEVSEKRLMTLKQYTGLGMGHKIALRDLKIRGSGNILGKEQSGQILSVGFDLYMYMLEETIMALKGIKKNTDEVELQLKVEAFVPETYIKDQALRISLYKRIYETETIDALTELYYETKDRFGTPPLVVARLFSLVKIKIYAKNAKVRRISKEEKGYFILFYEDKLSDNEKIHLTEKMKKSAFRLKFEYRGENQGLFLSIEDGKGSLDKLSNMLQSITFNK